MNKPTSVEELMEDAQGIRLLRNALLSLFAEAGVPFNDMTVVALLAIVQLMSDKLGLGLDVTKVKQLSAEELQLVADANAKLAAERNAEREGEDAEGVDLDVLFGAADKNVA